MLCILVVLSMVGMLIIQQNVQGFDAYYASLTPAEKLVFGSLGLFDIYHSWYFNVLLLILSLNIVLASIDHFPAAWSYIKDPKVWATREWLLGQKQNSVVRISAQDETELAETIQQVLKQSGLKPQINEAENLTYGIDENGNKDFTQIVRSKSLFVFGESGRWNRRVDQSNSGAQVWNHSANDRLRTSAR